MELWLDTIDFKFIAKACTQLTIFGVTTNPTILSQSNLLIKKVIQTLLNIQSGKVVVQVTESKAVGMINQAEKIIKFGPNIIVKIPVTGEGLAAIKALNNLNVATMATAIFHPHQVLLSALAGASYAAPYLGKIQK